MSIVSVNHAKRLILRKTKEGPVGDDIVPFISELTRGMSVSDTDIQMINQAASDLEDRQKIFTRMKAGRRQIVERYDIRLIQDMPPIASVLPTISKFELFIEMQALLVDMAVDGIIRSDLWHGEFVTMLHQKLSSKYNVSADDVAVVFHTSSTLDLRGNAKSIRGRGMSVTPLPFKDGDAREELQAARRHAEYFKGEAERVTRDLQNAHTELEAMRSHNASLQEDMVLLHAQIDLMKESSDRIRANNEELKKFPTALKEMLEKMLSTET